MEDTGIKRDDFYKHLFEHSSDAIVVFRVEDRTILEANPGACKLYGYTRTELTEADLGAALTVTLESGAPEGSAITYRRRDGAQIRLVVHSIPVEYNGTPAMLSIARDVTAQRETSESTDGSLRQYRSLFDLNPQPMWIVHRERKVFLAVNAAAIRHYGYSRDQFLSMKLSQVEVVSHGPASASCGGSGNYTKRCVHWTSSRKPIEVETASHQIDFGGSSAVLTLIHDVTEHNKIRRQLSSREAYYRALIENTQDLITVVNAAGMILYQSPSLIRMLGRRPDEINKRSCFDQVHPEDLAKVQRAFSESVLRQGAVTRTEFRVRHENGSWRVLEAIGRSLLNEPSIRGIVIHSRDVTESRWTQQALQQTNERLRLAQRAGQIGTWEFDFETQDLNCSPEHLQLHGLDRAPAGRKEWHLVFGPEDSEVFQAFTKTCETGEPLAAEYRIVLPDGSSRWLASRGEVQRSKDGRFERLTAITMDITERKRAEQQVAAARDEALEASRLKSQFLATVSHEIRTPMNGIIGMTSLLLDSDLQPQQKADAETIRTSATYLLDLINDLLDFAKIEAGKLTLEHAPFDLLACLETVTELLAPQALGRGLELSLEYPADMPRLYSGSAGRVRQIVLNFAANALKFTESGFVRISVTSFRQEDQSWVRICVSDSGPGIDIAAQGQLFNKFVQVDGSTTRRHGGTGLGLAISKGVAEAMGGNVGLHSMPGRGSDFWVDLPLMPMAGDFAVLNTGAVDRLVFRDENGCPLRVLVAEDNIVNQKLMVRLLEKRELQVDVANNGREAFDLWSRGRYNLILMDCQMPESDGFEATARIRSGEGISHRTPIVAVTAHAVQEQQRRCFESGMDDILTKPFHADQLDVILSTWLFSKAGGQQSGNSQESETIPILPSV